MMKLIRLGYRVEVWMGRIDGHLWITIYEFAASDALDVLLAVENVEELPGFEAEAAIHTRLCKYMLSKGL